MSPAKLSIAWRSPNLQPVSPVAIVAGIPVLYTVKADALLIVGLDPRTGSVLWARPAAGESTSPHRPLKVLNVGGRVVYLRPNPAQNDSSVVIAESKEGLDVATTPTDGWLDVPTACPDAPATICATTVRAATDSTEMSAQNWRIDVKTGVRTKDVAAPDPFVGGPLDQGLWSLVDSNATRIARLDGYRIVWSRRADDLFGQTADLTQPTRFARISPAGAEAAATESLLWRVLSPTHQVMDLSTSAITAGFAWSDGAPLRQQTGVFVGCWGQLDLRDSQGNLLPLRCRYRGGLDQVKPSADSPTTTTATSLDVTVERFDPRSGASLWSVAVGADLDLTEVGDGARTLLDESHLLLPVAPTTVTTATVPSTTTDSDQVIDLQTGQSRMSTKDDVFWCERKLEYEPKLLEYVPVAPRKSSGVFEVCDQSRSLTTRLPSVVPVGVGAGLDVNGKRITLVSTPSGVVAYA